MLELWWIGIEGLMVGSGRRLTILVQYVRVEVFDSEVGVEPNHFHHDAPVHAFSLLYSTDL